MILTPKLIKPPLGTPIKKGHPLAKGRVGYWLAYPGTTALDLSGNGHHANLMGSTHLSPGLFGPAFTFNAALETDYLDCSLGLIDGDWTVSLWVNGSDVGASIALIAGNGDSIKYEQWPDTGVLGLSNGGDHSFATATPFGRWAHLVFVRDGTNTHLYLDGIRDDTIANVLDLYFDSIGRRDPKNDNWFGGQIDNIIVKNYAVTAAEVAWLYREPFAMFERSSSIALLSYAEAAGEGIAILRRRRAG